MTDEREQMTSPEDDGRPSGDLAEGVAEESGADEASDPVAEAKAEAERYLANWQRAQADLINYRRRAEQEKEEAIKYGSVNLLKALLPVFDDLERAIANVPEDIAASSWFDGLKMLERKLQSTLQTQGIEEIAAEGETFDPNVHEAVLYEAGEEGKVTATFQKGYRLHGRVVRPSLVRVGSGLSSESGGDLAGSADQPGSGGS